MKTTRHNTLTTALACLIVAWAPQASAQQAHSVSTPSLAFKIESESDIASLSKPGGMGHAATIAQTTSGAILAAWWSGPERVPETDIWMSHFNPDKGAWTAPYKVFDGDEVAKDYTCENCMLFQPKTGPLMLFVLVGGAAYKKPGDNTLYYHNLRGYLKTSSDDGQTWSTPKALGDSPNVEGGHLIGPTKNAPIQFADGTILVGSSSEYGLLESRNWAAITFHFEKSTDGGKTWQFVQQCAKAANLAASHTMQPGFLRLGGGRLMALGRDNTGARGRDPVPFATSADNGRTWSPVTKSPNLQHNKAGICPLTLRDGTHVCLVNRDPGSSERDGLDLMVSPDSIRWSLGLNVQGTDGLDAHYPQAVQTADGKLHVVYTYGVHNKPGIIRHAVIATGISPERDIAATIWDAPRAQPPAAAQARYHVSAAGDDANPGTESQPVATIQKAVDSAQPGDLVYVHATGGPFFLERRLVVNNKKGAPGKPIRLFAYPGEAPVVDGSRIPTAGNDVMRLNNASWWHLRGLTFVHGPEAGLFLYGDCHDNLIERCTAAHNGRLSEYEGSGFVLWGPTVTTMAGNHLLNCDAHHNANRKGPEPFGHGDGFKLNVGGSGNKMTGCRAWHNGDDGYDFFYATRPIELRNCWAAKNGVDDARGMMSGHPAGKLGDGNGFKLGGDNSKGDTGGHTLIRCVAWGNPGTGFDENRGRKGVTLDQCTAWANGHHNFGFWDGGTPRHVFRNNIAAGPTPHNSAIGDTQNNTWNLGISDPQFASTDDSPALGPRAVDGSLPKSEFLHLLPSSPCRGTGIEGADLGAFPVARSVKK